MTLVLYFQCSIPVFNGLFPQPHNKAVLRLLFLTSHWHSLAKLRMHTNLTLEIFDSVTRLLGAEFWEFSDKTCSQFTTRELPCKRDACKQHLAEKSQSKRAQSSHASASSQVVAPTDVDMSLLRSLDINTSKHHSLGDYPQMIHRYGTTDSYSTEPVGC